MAGRVDQFHFFQYHLTAFTFIPLADSYDIMMGSTEKLSHLKVTVAGRVDPTTGMVLNISDLKVVSNNIIIKIYIKPQLTKKVWIQEVLKKIDHHNIDKEVEPFTKGQVRSYCIRLPI